MVCEPIDIASPLKITIFEKSDPLSQFVEPLRQLSSPSALSDPLLIQLIRESLPAIQQTEIGLGFRVTALRGTRQPIADQRDEGDDHRDQNCEQFTHGRHLPAVAGSATTQQANTCRSSAHS